MTMQMFSFGDEEIIELRKEIEETVNEAIGEAIRRSLYEAAVSVKITIDLGTTADEAGQVTLVPEYVYKCGYKIGGSYPGAKGKTRGKVGLQLQGPGVYRQVRLAEQMGMLEGNT